MERKVRIQVSLKACFIQSIEGGIVNVGHQHTTPVAERSLSKTRGFADVVRNDSARDDGGEDDG